MRGVEMEFMHFSHNHGLVYHQAIQGYEFHCSGCKSAGSGDVYVCWQCNYFLHEHCFRSERSLKHPYHPLHPLTLMPSPTYPSGSFSCNSCSLDGDGFSYSCSECEFDIHVHCALNITIPNPNPNLLPSVVPNPYPAQNNNPPRPIQSNAYPTYPPQNTGYSPNPNHPYPNFTTPNHITPPFPIPKDPPNQNNNSIPAYPQPNIGPSYNYVPPANPAGNPPPPKPTPNLIKHFSHPHGLKGMEIKKKNAKVCSACEIELNGAAYCCTESQCNFNLHKTCFDAPLKLRHKSHPEHPLTLLTAPPYGEGFTCDACMKEGKAFVYTCTTCSNDLHINCAQRPEKMVSPGHKHTLTLYYSSRAAANREVTFTCDVCMSLIDEMAWVYYCRKCDFGTHLDCVTSAVKQQSGGGSSSDVVRISEAADAVNAAAIEAFFNAKGRIAAWGLI
ncbi:hypothetical protein ABFX02_02G128200 [Erythranthe guttata]